MGGLIPSLRCTDHTPIVLHMSPLGNFQQISCKAQTGMYGPHFSCKAVYLGLVAYMPVWALQLATTLCIYDQPACVYMYMYIHV